MSSLHLAIFSPFLMAILIPFIFKLFRKLHIGWFVLILPSILFLFFLSKIPLIKDGGVFKATLNWIPSFDINFVAYLDGLGLLFTLLITGIGSLVVLYSIFYLDKNKEKLHNFYVYLLLFMGAMLGVVLSDNLIVLYTFWELTSFSSFLLIGYWNTRERSRYGAQKSMLITVFGGLSMLGGFILLSIMTGSFSIHEIMLQSNTLISNEWFLPALILVLLGAFTKSAQFPFYIWLPDAMEAPTPVSAYLHSATMVKAGIYLVARLTPIFAFHGAWFWIISLIGIITMCWASFNAVKQTDLKGILAFSTVSQLGLIMSLLGLGSASLHYDFLSKNIYMGAIVAAVFHLINHATFKGSLFMVAGIVDHETGTRDIRKLGGLMYVMPITFTIAVVGTLSMAGLPPFNGFLSKEMFFTSVLNVLQMNIFQMETWGILFPILAWLGSVFTFIYSILLLLKTFTGKLQEEKLDKKPHEAPLGMLFSPIVLGALVIIFGFFPNILSRNILEPAVASILPNLLQENDRFAVHIRFWHGFNLELLMTIGVVVVGILLYLTLKKWGKIYNIFPKRFTLNRFYEKGIDITEKGSYSFTRRLMNGSIRSYLIYIFIFFIGIVTFTLVKKDAIKMDTTNLASIGIYEITLAVIIILGSITILGAKSRLTSIIALGAVGYTVSLFYILFRAPDLALTQLVIETVSTALFLLAFYHLPQLSRKEEHIGFKLTNALISIGVGLVITIVAISAHSNKMFDSIAKYYIENTHDKAGGGNLVNVILVDFRGFDTMFEISVLGIAALGIYGMIKLRLSNQKKQQRRTADENK